jgi:hypothetical protein
VTWRAAFLEALQAVTAVIAVLALGIGGTLALITLGEAIPLGIFLGLLLLIVVALVTILIRCTA